MRVLFVLAISWLALHGCAPLPLAASAGAVAGSYANEQTKKIHSAPIAAVPRREETREPLPHNPIGFKPQITPNHTLVEAQKKLQERCDPPMKSTVGQDYSLNANTKPPKFEKPSYQLKNEEDCEPIKLPSR